MTKKKFMKKVFVLMTIFCMLLTCMPAMAFAEEQPETDAQSMSAQSAEETVVQDEAADEASEDSDVKIVTDQPEEKTEQAVSEEEAASEDTQESAEVEEATEVAEPEKEAAAEEEAQSDVSFTADQADYLSYDPLYIAKYANRDYVNVDEMDMNAFVNIASAAKGIAAYTIDKDKKLDDDTFIAGMNYEMPIYNVDDASKYYVAIPNVNKFNGTNFKAFGLIVAYNNDYAEQISGWKYEKGILYIPKTAVDSPKNKNEVPEAEPIAVQLNYAIGNDMDFSKTIPVQVVNGKDPKDSKVRTENIFDVDGLVVSTGVKGRKSSDVSVFLNGQMIPINDDAWEYDKVTGDISIKAMPGVVSNINVIFQTQTTMEKVKSTTVSALNLFSEDAYAGDKESMDEMKFLRNDDGEKVKLKFDVSKMFVGWRGHYKSEVIHGNSTIESQQNNLKGYLTSRKYMYGGYTKYVGAMEQQGISDEERDQMLVPLWAIQSFAVAADVRTGDGDQHTLTYNEDVTQYLLDSEETDTMTIYEWLREYRNTLERTADTVVGNGIGGSNNFAANWPVNMKVEGSDKGLVPNDSGSGAKANPDFRFETSEIDNDEWYAASCSELGDAAESDNDGHIYVTCLGLTEKYIVLAFVQVRKGQNMTAIYKFELNVGYATLVKSPSETQTDFLEEAPNNYTLAGAVYELYTDAACTERAKDISGNDITLTTDADGKTDIIAVEADKAYYAKEITASKGFLLDENINSVTVTTANTQDNPAVIKSVEEPTLGIPIKIRKVNSSGNDGWKKLIGAEYTLSYYDVDPSTTEVSGNPTRSWTFKTIEKKNTVTNFSEAGIDFATDTDNFVEGDEFYTEITEIETLAKDSETKISQVKIDEDGDTSRILPCGVYTIEETKAPAGLVRNETVYYGKVYQKANGEIAFTQINTKLADDMWISADMTDGVDNDEKPQEVTLVIDKRNKRTGEASATESEESHSSTRLGNYSTLAGAKYEVYFDDLDLGMPELIGWITTDENGHGELSEKQTGRPQYIGDPLEVGTYYIREIESAPGFVLDKYTFTEDEDGTKTQVLTSDETVEVIASYEEDGTVKTKTIKGKFENYEKSQEEKEVIVSWDSRYNATTSTIDTGHVFTTRAEIGNNQVFMYTEKSNDEPTRLYVSKQDITTGEELPGATLQIYDRDTNELVEQWVSTDEPRLIYELPTGNYLLREITAPYGYDIAEDIEFEIEDNKIVHQVEMKNKPIEIGTTAKDAETDTHQGIRKTEDKIIDTVKVSGLYEGRTYQISGKLWDKKAGDFIKDADGNDLVAVSDPFEATGDEMEVEMTFTVDSTGFDSDVSLVAFEYLTRVERFRDEPTDFPDEDFPKELQKHDDPDDEDQTVHYGEIIGTTAIDKESQSHNILAAEDVTIVDTVKFENLSTEETYTIEGELYDKTTGERTGIKASTSFKPETNDGTVDIEFTFDASELADHTLVAYEVLLINGIEINRHENPDDEDQTVYVPEIGTEAEKAKGGKKVVIDTVSYSNLIPGKTYIMKGYLVSKKTGKKIKGSDGEVTFTPAEASGEIEMKLSAKKGSGKLVAYEFCYIVSVDGKTASLVGQHADIDDEDQSVTFKNPPKTGDDYTLYIAGGVFIVCAACAAIYFARKRKKDDGDDKDILA